MNEAEVADAATVTDGGIVSADVLSLRLTTVPPAGAIFDIVTVHVVLALVARLAAVHWKFETVVPASRMVSV